VTVGEPRHRGRAVYVRLPKLAAGPIELDNARQVVKRREDSAIGEDFDVAAERVYRATHLEALQFPPLWVEQLAKSAAGGDGNLAVAQTLSCRDTKILGKPCKDILAVVVHDPNLLSSDDERMAIRQALATDGQGGGKLLENVPLEIALRHAPVGIFRN